MVHDGLQGSAGCAVARLDRDAVEDRGVEGCRRVQVHAWWPVVGDDALPESLLDGPMPTCTVVAQEVDDLDASGSSSPRDESG